MYSAGKQRALESYGLTKVAFSWGQLRNTAATGGSWVRNLLVGAPGTLQAIRNQARAGTLFAKPPGYQSPSQPGNFLEKGIYHNPLGWLVPEINFGKKGDPLINRAGNTALTALSVLGPVQTAYSMYQALKAPPEYRSEAVGGLLGSLAGSTVLGPFGALGQVVGGSVGSALGAGAGRNLAPYVDPAYRRDESVG